MAISDLSASCVRRLPGLKMKRHSSTSDLGECPVRLQRFASRLTWSRTRHQLCFLSRELVSDDWRGHTTGRSRLRAVWESQPSGQNYAPRLSVESSAESRRYDPDLDAAMTLSECDFPTLSPQKIRCFFCSNASTALAHGNLRFIGLLCEAFAGVEDEKALIHIRSG